MKITRSAVLALAHGVRPWIAVGTVLRLLVLACYLGQGYLLAAVLGGLLVGRGIAEQAGPLIWLAVLVVVRAALLWTSSVTAQLTGARTTELLRARAFRKLAELGPVHLTGARTGELREALVDGVESLERYYGSYLPALIAGLVAPVSVVVLLAVQDVGLAVLVALFAVAALVLPRLWARPLTARSSERMTEYLGLGARFLDVLQGMLTLKLFGATGRQRSELAETSERLIRRWNREMAVALVTGGIYALAITGGLAATAVLAALSTRRPWSRRRRRCPPSGISSPPCRSRACASATPRTARYSTALGSRFRRAPRWPWSGRPGRARPRSSRC
jgi:ATP-binding cassette subfamily C protein CydD